MISISDNFRKNFFEFENCLKKEDAAYTHEKKQKKKIKERERELREDEEEENK